MAGKARNTARVRRTQAAGRSAPVGAAEFKARCLELIDRVRETRAEYVVTKHGTPVAKLVPYDPPDRPKSFFGSMRGTLLRYDRPFDPIPGEWLLEPLVKKPGKKDE
jgi:prevent-host-death family protein